MTYESRVKKSRPFSGKNIERSMMREERDEASLWQLGKKLCAGSQTPPPSCWHKDSLLGEQKATVEWN